ncbi:MAG: hypothetical protein JW997_05240, partial [Actinobacteria bacterium]|nr:hypothetical protein [Actinomycetota bacterium]
FFFAGYVPLYYLLVKNNFDYINCNNAPSLKSLTFKNKNWPGLFFIFFLSFYAGIFVISNYLIILSLIGIAYSTLNAAVFSLACFLLFCAIIITDRKNKQKVTLNSHRRQYDYNSLSVTGLEDKKTAGCILFFKKPWLEKSLFALSWLFIFICFLVVVFFAFLFPVRFWDAISCWSLKGRAFFIDGGLLPFYTFHNYEFSHLSYPLYIPLSQTWIYTWLGYADERLVKIIFPMFYLSLISIFYFCFRKKYSRLLSSALVLIIAGLPVVMDHGYLEYTNLIFAIILFIAVYLFAESLRSQGKGYILASAIFFTILAQIRSEGAFFLAIFLASNIFYIIFKAFKEKRQAKKYKGIEIKKPGMNAANAVFYATMPPAVAAFLMIPWQILKKAANIPFISNEWARLSLGGNGTGLPGLKNFKDFLVSLNAGGSISFDITDASKALFSQLAYSAYDSARAFLGSSYGIVWVALGILFFLNIKKMFLQTGWVYPLFIIPGFIMLFISLCIIPEFIWSADRYVLHFLPLTYFWILYNLPLFKNMNGRKNTSPL